jgi:hypothetical protein
LRGVALPIGEHGGRPRHLKKKLPDANGKHASTGFVSTRVGSHRGSRGSIFRRPGLLRIHKLKHKAEGTIQVQIIPTNQIIAIAVAAAP